MEKSAIAKNLDEVQAKVAAFLKPLGFQKKGRTHNRTTAGGLRHVVNFQMGAYPVGEHYEIPGLREDLYGQFTVNLGVLLPCVFELDWKKSVPPFVKEYDCSIRERLGTLAFGTDTWFDLKADSAAIATEVVQLMDRFGLPFLEQFNSYEGVLEYYDLHRELSFQNEARAAFESGIVAHHLGDVKRSKCYFGRAQSFGRGEFASHVASVAKELGIELD